MGMEMEKKSSPSRARILRKDIPEEGVAQQGQPLYHFIRFALTDPHGMSFPILPPPPQEPPHGDGAPISGRGYQSPPEGIPEEEGAAKQGQPSHGMSFPILPPFPQEPPHGDGAPICGRGNQSPH